jgi:hypothetical protein
VNTEVTATASCTGSKTLLFGGAYLSFTGGERAVLVQSAITTPGANGTFTAVGRATVAGSGS